MSLNYKLSEENKGENLCDFGFWCHNDNKAKVTKGKLGKLNFIKI